MKIKKIEIMIPEYLTTLNAIFLSWAENLVNTMMIRLPITLKIRKGIH